MALFKINNIFQITSRGSVLAGEIIEGEIDSGYAIQLNIEGEIIELKIKSVEFVDHGGGYAEIGLMLGFIREDIIEILKKMHGEAVFILMK
jgi:GTPase